MTREENTNFCDWFVPMKKGMFDCWKEIGSCSKPADKTMCPAIEREKKEWTEGTSILKMSGDENQINKSVRALISAILLAAIHDARKKDQESIEWMAGNTCKNLFIWLGLDPEMLDEKKWMLKPAKKKNGRKRLI